MLWVNMIGFALIAVITWWFWLFKPKARKAENGEVVLVDDGIYSPARILIKRGQPQEITFLRKDASPCAEMLIIPELDISETLPLNKPKSIHLPELETGEYSFHCQMQMYKGVLQVD